MSKKIISVFLSVLIAFSVSLSVMASDTSDVENSISDSSVLTTQHGFAAAETVIGAFLQMTEGNGTATLLKPVEGTLSFRDSDVLIPQRTTVGELKSELSHYFVLPYEAAAEAVSNVDDIATFTYVAADSQGHETVYIAVNIEEHPEILKLDVFRETVKALYQKQGEVFTANNGSDSTYLMSYEHIAGELALHAIVFAATDNLIKITGLSPDAVVKWRDQAKVANLNYDENRVPSAVIDLIGKILTSSVWDTILSLLSSINK